MTDKPISPLRQRMIEDMTARHFAEKAQTDYIRYVKSFAAFLGRPPDTAGAEDLRLFQQHMTKTHVSPGVVNATVVALRFFFKVTLERDDLVRRLTLVSEPRRVPIVLSPEEVARLLTAAPGVKYRAALGVAYGAGLRVSEVVALKVTDIDRERMLLRVEQGKGQKDRFVMLSPQLLELLRDWRQVAQPRGWLFPGLDPVNPMSARQLCRAVSAAARAAGIAKRVSPHTLRHSFASICSNRTSISGSSKSCSEQPHTTRQPHSERQIYYRFHPQCGETVPILRQFACRGVDLVAIPQPDGSVACIPAWMTHESSAHHQLCVEPGFSLDVLRSLRSEIDALLSFLPSDSKVEKAHDDEEVRRCPTRSIRSGRAACRPGASAEDPSCGADRSAASRNRSGTGRRGGRR